MNENYLAPLIYERDRWQAMADQSPALVWISNAEGTVTGFNQTWLSWRGRELHQELDGGWIEAIHPDDMFFYAQSVATAVSDRAAVRTQIRLRDAYGTFQQVTVSGRAWQEADGSFGGYVFAGQPAPEAVGGLAGSADLFKATIEALHEGVVVTDAEGHFVWVNESAAQFLGIERTDLLGAELGAMTGEMHIIDEDGKTVDASVRPTIVARRTRTVVSDKLLGWRVHDRGLRWFSVNSRPLLNANGAIMAVVTSFLDVTAQKHAADDARHEARHDALTGLVNRWGLRDVVRQVLERAPRLGEDVALLYCDVDNFKLINDSLGHGAGDDFLRGVAHRIKSCVRSGDVVARIGGDEVVVVLDEVQGLDGALRAAEKIREYVARPMGVRDTTVVPHLSIGVALLDGIDTFDETLTRADEAMYAAKASGRNRVVTLDRDDAYSGSGRPNK